MIAQTKSWAKSWIGVGLWGLYLLTATVGAEPPPAKYRTACQNRSQLGQSGISSGETKRRRAARRRGHRHQAATAPNLPGRAHEPPGGWSRNSPKLTRRPYRGLVETRQHRGRLSSMSLSPDCKLAATGGVDGAIHIWDLETGKLVRVIVGHSGHVTSVSWSPDGNSIASGGWGDGTNPHLGRPQRNAAAGLQVARGRRTCGLRGLVA